MGHQAETELRQTYVLIWGESDNASSVKCIVCQVHGTGPHTCQVHGTGPHVASGLWMRNPRGVSRCRLQQGWARLRLFFDTQPAPYKAHLGGARCLLWDDCRHTISCPGWIMTRGRFCLLRRDVRPHALTRVRVLLQNPTRMTPGLILDSNASRGL